MICELICSDEVTGNREQELYSNWSKRKRRLRQQKSNSNPIEFIIMTIIPKLQIWTPYAIRKFIPLALYNHLTTPILRQSTYLRTEEACI